MTGARGPTGNPSATADCVELARLPDRPAPPLAIVELGDGTRRITSADGGYSIIAPTAWSVTGSFSGAIDPLFGQVHLGSFDRQRVQTPRPEAGYMLPPMVGINLDIEIWQNPKRDPLERYALGVGI